MRKILISATLLLGALTGMAQEKVMNIQKTDGTSSSIRVAELKQISFLTIDEGVQGLLVKTTGGQTTAVCFETNPVVTIAKGSLTVKQSVGDPVVVELTEIEEIVFGDASNADAIGQVEGFACVMQEGGALLRGIPEGTVPHIYKPDGSMLPTPPFRGGELRLSRETLGTGIFIVKVGTFTAKIKL